MVWDIQQLWKIRKMHNALLLIHNFLGLHLLYDAILKEFFNDVIVILEHLRKDLFRVLSKSGWSALNSQSPLTVSHSRTWRRERTKYLNDGPWAEIDRSVCTGSAIYRTLGKTHEVLQTGFISCVVFRKSTQIAPMENQSALKRIEFCRFFH